MAERRMFAKTIIDSDAFIDMPLSTQALYFHLSMRADDDGFINNPKKIQRMWFFGVVDFDSDKELRVEMHDNWLPLFSEVGSSYYKQIEVSPTDKELNILSDEKVKMDIVLISHDALIGNAKARNDTFLSLLKNSIKEFSVSISDT